jgi:Secretion system C-terminal sorting domain
MKYICLFAILFAKNGLSQTVLLTYDSYGNRITKSVTGTYPQPVLTGDAEKCKGDTARLYVSGGTSYAWSTGSTQNSIAFRADSTKLYSVTAYNSLGCAKTVSRLFKVNPLPQTTAIVGDTVINAGSQTFYTVAQHPNSFYNWQVTNNANNIIAGGYGINKVYINWVNMPDTATISVQERDNITQCVGPVIKIKVRVAIPKVVNDIDVRLAPNPSRNDTRLTIQMSRVQDLEIVILNTVGQKLKNYSLAGNWNYTISLPSNLFMSSGIYYVQVLTNDKKIVKKLEIIR